MVVQVWIYSLTQTVSDHSNSESIVLELLGSDAKYLSGVLAPLIPPETGIGFALCQGSTKS